jgi:hypothetical protein
MYELYLELAAACFNESAMTPDGECAAALRRRGRRFLLHAVAFGPDAATPPPRPMIAHGDDGRNRCRSLALP